MICDDIYIIVLENFQTKRVYFQPKKQTNTFTNNSEQTNIYIIKDTNKSYYIANKIKLRSTGITNIPIHRTVNSILARSSSAASNRLIQSGSTVCIETN